MESMSPVNHSGSGKRARSPSDDPAGPPSKSVKTGASATPVNYLARHSTSNIHLLSSNDTLPAILRVIGDYDAVLQRHESLAGNLGACPVAPLLLKRFERLFEGPPRILKSNGKDPHVSWLDVVDFARNKPEQFNLEKMRNNLRVCQFYTKQCRVEISEEDYVLINSGMPQKLIPPQPIQEDEEKELGALELVQKNLNQIASMAEQVTNRARQLNHRLKSRKTAIISRREAEAEGRGARTSESYASVADSDKGSRGLKSKFSQSPSLGFTAVNSKFSSRQDRPQDASSESPTTSISALISRANTDNLTIVNGSYIKGASEKEREELIRKSLANSDLIVQDDHSHRKSSHGDPESKSVQDRLRKRSEPSSNSNGIGTGYSPTPASAVAIPTTPASLLAHLRPTQADRDDGGPYKAAMMSRMEALPRGGRIQPPCDRCRRLHMDCLKNMTACQGCTRKHAKCSWKDVREEELRDMRADGHSRSASSSPDGTEEMEAYFNIRELDLLPPAAPAANATPAVGAHVQASPDSGPSRLSGSLPPTKTAPTPTKIPDTVSSLLLRSPKTKFHAPVTTVTAAAAAATTTQSSATNAESRSTSDRADLLNHHLPRSLQGLGDGDGNGDGNSGGGGSGLPRSQVPARAVNADEDEEEEEYQDPLQVLAAQVYRTKSA